MARKAYSEQEREQVRIALLTTMLQCIVDRGLIHSSIDVLCKQVGISKTFFYTFFPSKEELVLEALRYQQPKLLQYARRLMRTDFNWQESVRTFLETCVYGEKKGIAVLSIEEEQEIYRCLSQENFQTFRNDQTKLFRDLLEIFGLSRRPHRPTTIWQPVAVDDDGLQSNPKHHALPVSRAGRGHGRISNQHPAGCNAAGKRKRKQSERRCAEIINEP